MKRLFEFLRMKKRTCPVCFGMGVIETASGNTIQCRVCHGTGRVE